MTDWQAVAENIADKLKGHQTAQGWRIHCPIHDDRDPSLDMTIKGDTLLMKCRVGCAQDELITALRSLDLWPKNGDRLRGKLIDEANRVASYHYIDPTTGEVQAVKHRYERIADGERKKAFQWVQPDGTVGLPDGTDHLYPYNAGALAKNTSAAVVVVEGEKVVDTLKLVLPDRFVPISLAGGADATWSDQNVELLRGRDVAILPDYDQAGYRLLGRTLGALKDVADHVCWVKLPELPPKGDAADWFAAGHTAAEFEDLLAKEFHLEAPAEAELPTVGTLPHHDEAERIILGAILLVQKDAFESVRLERDEFYVAAHQILWEIFCEQYEQNRGMGLQTVRDILAKRNQLAEVGGTAYLQTLEQAGRTHYAEFLAEQAELVRRAAVQRKVILAGEKVTAHGWEGKLDPEDLVQAAYDEVIAVASSHGTNEFVDMPSLMASVESDLERMARHEGDLTGLPTGITRLDEATSGLQKKDLVILAARPSMGKSLANSEPVLMADGSWKAIGQMEVGDRVASVDGECSSVVGVFPQGVLPLYEVEFSDGRSVQASGDHLWSVYYRDWPESRTLTTLEVLSLLEKKRYQGRIWIDVASGDWGHEDDLPLDPWVLGAYLGDGSRSGQVFSSNDPEVLDRLASRLGSAYAVNHVENYDYRITQPGCLSNGLMVALREMGLGCCRSWEKFIPRPYLTASRQARVELLRGLLDTDGWVETHGSVCFSTASEELAHDVEMLARSLGCVVNVRERNKSYTYKGEKRQGKTAYAITISHENLREFVTLSRKKERIPARRRQRRLTFESITPVGSGEATCIAVSHPSKLFLTREYIVTHNTALALNIAHHVAVKGYKVAIFSVEMSDKQLGQRLLSLEGNIPHQQIRTGKIEKSYAKGVRAALERLQRRPIYVDDVSSTVLEMRAKAQRLKRESGLDLILVDYLQLMNGSSQSKKFGAVSETTEISKGLKRLAKDLDVPVLALSQLSRAPEQRPNHRPIMSDLRESGSIEQDADLVMFLYRDEYYHPLDSDKPTETPGMAELDLQKHRNGPTGKFHLAFDETQMRFSSISPDSFIPQEDAA